ncbi:MAG TPA: hypothetical protein VKN36_14190 [Eudoraea sp.]|nr:hypothetical protein [Eudoraea sp.]
MQPQLVYLFPFAVVSGLRAQEAAFFGPQFIHAFTGEKFHAAGGSHLEGVFWKHLRLSCTALQAPTGPDQCYFYTAGGRALGVYRIQKAFEGPSCPDLAIPTGLFRFILPERMACRTPPCSLQGGHLVPCLFLRNPFRTQFTNE